MQGGAAPRGAWSSAKGKEEEPGPECDADWTPGLQTISLLQSLAQSPGFTDETLRASARSTQALGLPHPRCSLQAIIAVPEGAGQGMKK